LLVQKLLGKVLAAQIVEYLLPSTPAVSAPCGRRSAGSALRSAVPSRPVGHGHPPRWRSARRAWKFLSARWPAPGLLLRVPEPKQGTHARAAGPCPGNTGLGPVGDRRRARGV